MDRKILNSKGNSLNIKQKFAHWKKISQLKTKILKSKKNFEAKKKLSTQNKSSQIERKYVNSKEKFQLKKNEKGKKNNDLSYESYIPFDFQPNKYCLREKNKKQ